MLRAKIIKIDQCFTELFKQYKLASLYLCRPVHAT